MEELYNEGQAITWTILRTSIIVDDISDEDDEDDEDLRP